MASSPPQRTSFSGNATTVRRPDEAAPRGKPLFGRLSHTGASATPAPGAGTCLKGRFSLRSAPRPVNLALQGGGAHGAFTWGVLDALIADPRLQIEGLSGSSTGALDAVVRV